MYLDKSRLSLKRYRSFLVYNKILHLCNIVLIFLILICREIYVREYRRESAEKLATQDTQDQDKKHKHNAIWVGHHNMQTTANNVNKT